MPGELKILAGADKAARLVWRPPARAPPAEHLTQMQVRDGTGTISIFHPRFPYRAFSRRYIYKKGRMPFSLKI